MDLICNMVEVNPETVFIKKEPADEETDSNKHTTDININDSRYLIKSEPVDSDFIIPLGAGYGKIEIEIEAGIKEEGMSDVEDNLDLCDINMESGRSKLMQMNPIEECTEYTSHMSPFAITQEFNSQSEDHSQNMETEASTFNRKRRRGPRRKPLETDKSKQLICKICDRLFKLKTNFARHMRNHPALFTCTYCSYKTKQKHHLSRHINSIHTKDVAYNCSYCDYSAFQKHQLAIHINSNHTKSTAYACSYCDFKTYRKSILSQHENCKHTKSTFYYCNHCDYKTLRTCNLTRHIQNIHTEKTPYHCTQCTFVTDFKNTFRKHKMQHKKDNLSE